MDVDPAAGQEPRKKPHGYYARAEAANTDDKVARKGEVELSLGALAVLRQAMRVHCAIACLAKATLRNRPGVEAVDARLEEARSMDVGHSAGALAR